LFGVQPFSNHALQSAHIMESSSDKHERRSSLKIGYDGVSLDANKGERLLDVILKAGIEHRHVCGGNGFCTSCRVEVVEGSRNLTPVSRLEVDRLGKEAGRLRLACQARIYGPCSVTVPAPSSDRFSPFDDDE
jgi:ferredoxin